MKLFWGLLLTSLLLTGCGGSSSDSDNNSDSGDSVKDDTDTGTDSGNDSSGTGNSDSNSDILTGADPLLEHQWYHYNYGQSALTSNGSGGTPGADINAYSSSDLSIENYAKGYSGQGVEVAVLDTGLEIAHEDLAPNVITNGSYDFRFGDNNPTSSSTDGDHGTSVAGLLAARGDNAIGMSGTAPKAKLRGFNILASGAELNDELAALGLASAAQNYNDLHVANVGVFNKSYGRNPTEVEDPNSSQGQTDAALIGALQTGTEELRGGKGAIYVKAGGNEYSGGSVFDSDWCSQAIARDITCYNVNQEPEQASPYQIVTGAFNANDKRSSYSNTGSALWVVAPGGEFGSTSPALLATDQSGCSKGYSRDSNLVDPNTDFNTGEQNTGNESCNYYSAFNGSSASTPLVSGVAALIMEAYPEATWRDIKHILASTARQLDPTLSSRTMLINAQQLEIDQAWVENAAGHHFSNEYGFGAVDVQAAMAMAEEWKASDEHLGTLQKIAVNQQAFTSDNEIPDRNRVGITKTQTISNQLTLESVALTINISALSASFNRADNDIDASDYLIKVKSPSGTTSIMMTPFNAFKSGYDLSPFTMISHAFYGESLSGDWTLQVIDVDSSSNNFIDHAGEGKLDSFQFTFYGH